MNDKVLTPSVLKTIAEETLNEEIEAELQQSDPDEEKAAASMKENEIDNS